MNRNKSLILEIFELNNKILFEVNGLFGPKNPYLSITSSNNLFWHIGSAQK